MSKPTISPTRHNLGESFLHALDDIRQKLVEEGWTGTTQTVSATLQMQYSDFVAWMNGGNKTPPVQTAGERDQLARTAIVHALQNGAGDVAREIGEESGLRQWAAGLTATATPLETKAPEIESPGLEM